MKQRVGVGGFPVRVPPHTCPSSYNKSSSPSRAGETGEGPQHKRLEIWAADPCGVQQTSALDPAAAGRGIYPRGSTQNQNRHPQSPSPQLAELQTGQLATMGDGLNPRCSRFPGAGGRHSATQKRVVAAQPRRMNRVRHSSPPLLDKAHLP